MIAGADGFGGINFNDYELAYRVGTVALILILFDGGLNTPMRSIRQSVAPASMLATFGVLLTAILVALGRLPIRRSALESGNAFGGRGKLYRCGCRVFRPAFVRHSPEQAHRKHPRMGIWRQRSHGGDPYHECGAAVIHDSYRRREPPSKRLSACHWPRPWDRRGARWGRHLKLCPFPFRRPLSRAHRGFGHAIFAIPSLMWGSGFLAVYVAAVIIGNKELPHQSSLRRVHDAVAWFAQVGLFLLMGLLVNPSELLKVGWSGLLIALFLAFIARPAAVLLSLIPFDFQFRDRIFLSWVGLRGAVPILLATIPVMQGVPNAETILISSSLLW